MAIKFSREVSGQITDFLVKTKNLNTKKVAFFDADGTLWFGDLGESFLEYQIEHGLLNNPPEHPVHKDPWKYYWDTVLNGDAREAYNWPIQWNAGTELAKFQKMARDFFKEVHSKFVFKPVQKLISQLQAADFEVWVITASTQLVVAEAVNEAFGLPKDRVIGAQVEIKNGVLTDKLLHELPYREAKVRMAQKFIKEKPLFAAGNTVWDHPMLSLSEGLVLTIHSEVKGQFNYESEQELKTKAEEMNLMPGNTVPWLIQKFSHDDFK